MCQHVFIEENQHLRAVKAFLVNRRQQDFQSAIYKYSAGDAEIVEVVQRKKEAARERAQLAENRQTTEAKEVSGKDNSEIQLHIDQSGDQTGGQTSDQTGDQTGDQTSDQTCNQMADQTGTNTMES